MYAVIKTGGKQYKVSEGQTLKVETLTGEPGQEVLFDQVLMVANGEDVKLGKPMLDGAKVKASVVGHGRGKKVRIIKFRRRKDSMLTQGHRQNFTEVKIEQITA